MPEIPSRAYQQPAARVFDAALRAVQAAGYRIENIDEDSGLLNFSTKTSALESLFGDDHGQAISLLIRDDGTGATRVSVSGHAQNQWQWDADRSQAKIAEALFDQIDAFLAGVV